MTEPSTTQASQSHSPAIEPDVAHGGVWQRLQRHKVLQWTLAYAAAAYTVLHATQMVVESFDWPHVIVRVVALGLVLALPIVVLLAWYHGHKAQHRISTGELSILTVLLLIAGTVMWGFTRGRAPTERAVSVSTAPAAIPTQSASPVPAASVAVVPFTNLTGEAGKEYFSDGMAEELINELTKVPGLKVPARTSSFAYKGRNIDIRQIARDLGVATILEGSVRSAGERIRVTAQLINAQTGYHIWSNTYDGNFGDVFKVQDDISAEIVEALKSSMKVQLPAATAQVPPTRDPEAYRLYLQAQSADDFATSLSWLDKAIARDPRFGRAIASKALRYVDSLRGGGGAVLSDADALRHAKQYATEALAIDPGLAEGHVVLANISAYRGEWLPAESEYREALRLWGGNALVHVDYAVDVLMSAGHVHQALDEVRTAYALAPGDAEIVVTTAAAYTLLGADGEAVRYANVASELLPHPAENALLSIVYVNAAVRAGRYAEAASRTVAAAIPQGMHSPSGSRTIADVFAAFGDPPRRAPAARALTALIEHLSSSADFEAVTRKNVIAWYVGLGDLDSAFRLANQSLDKYARQGTVGTAWAGLWLPEMRPFRRDARFQPFATRLKLFDYWKQYGPPDDCDVRGETLTCR